MVHNTKNEFAGKTVKIKSDVPIYGGQAYHVEDWWDRVMGKSWMVCDGNPACLKYAIRAGSTGLPIDNEVLYGKINGLGELLHTSEIEAIK